MIDVIGGHTQMAFGSILTITHLRSGKLRALGVGSATRSTTLPDVPTVVGAGLPGYEAANWIGIVAPAGTPPAIIEKLHKEISLMQETPEARKQFANEGAEVDADELRRLRQVHRVGDRQMGPRREGGRHQGQ